MAKGVRLGFGVKTVACAAMFAAMGCSASTGSESDTRTLEGKLAVGAFPSRGAVIVAQSLDGPRFVAGVDVDGRFRLTVPTGNTYRLLIAQRLASGSYSAMARVSFPLAASRTRWVEVPREGGSVVSLGTVRPIANGSDVAVRSYGSGSDGSGSSGSGSGSGSGDSDDGNSSSGYGSDGGTTSGGDLSPASDCAHQASGEADLPYDVRPGVGDTFKLADAFAAKGPQPASVVKVTMDGGSWRLKELAAGTPFTITQADCDHVGNRDVGRDRIFVTWKNADGSSETDHLDMRYCKGGGGSGGGSSSSPTPAPAAAPDDCADGADDDAPVCEPAAPLPECTCEAETAEVKPTACEGTDCEGADDETEGACDAAPAY